MNKNDLIELLLSPKFRTFYWTTTVNALGLIAFALTGSDWIYAAPVLAILNATTKYLNQTYL